MFSKEKANTYVWMRGLLCACSRIFVLGACIRKFSSTFFNHASQRRLSLCVYSRVEILVRPRKNFTRRYLREENVCLIVHVLKKSDKPRSCACDSTRTNMHGIVSCVQMRECPRNLRVHAWNSKIAEMFCVYMRVFKEFIRPHAF